MDLLSGAEIKCPVSVLERVRIIEVFFKENMDEFYQERQIITFHWRNALESTAIEAAYLTTCTLNHAAAFVSTTGARLKMVYQRTLVDRLGNILKEKHF